MCASLAFSVHTRIQALLQTLSSSCVSWLLLVCEEWTGVPCLLFRGAVVNKRTLLCVVSISAPNNGFCLHYSHIIIPSIISHHCLQNGCHQFLLLSLLISQILVFQSSFLLLSLLRSSSPLGSVLTLCSVVSPSSCFSFQSFPVTLFLITPLAHIRGHALYTSFCFHE